MTADNHTHGVHVLGKPIGPICNLDCTYCYYLHKEDLYPENPRWRMSPETLARFVHQYIAAQPASQQEITFAWQGGEPTLLGVEFFERVVELQRQACPPGKVISNSLQTNGVLLDDRWCEFLRSERFLVGLSLDGPQELHDRYRVDRKGGPTFPAVMAALRRLKRWEIPYNVLVTVHRANAAHGRRVYRFLRDQGVQFMQFIPIVERRGVGRHGEPLTIADATRNSGVSQDTGAPPRQQAGANPATEHPATVHPATVHPATVHSDVSSRSVAPEQYGDFLIEIFDYWVRRDVGRVFVQIFDEALAAWVGREPSLCIFRKRCGGALALEHNGDVYSCDHFVDPEHLLGNIHRGDLSALARSDQQRAFGAAKETALPQYCRACEVRFVCNGGCPKNRFRAAPDGEAGLNYLCAGYRKFFNHIRPAMELMADQLRRGRSAANVATELAAREASAGGSRRGHAPRRPASAGSSSFPADPPAREPVLRPRSGAESEAPPAAADRPHSPPRSPAGSSGKPRRAERNGLCPCGSGRKYKKCCLRKR